MARKKVEMTPEMKLAQEREMAIRDIGDTVRYLNEPTYRYNVGDHVTFGALKDAVVEEIFNDGKAYLLKCVATNNNYGKPYDYECYRAAKWVEIRTSAKDNDTHFTKKAPVDLHFMNQTIESLIHRYYNFGVDMNPDYQRGFVWTQEDKEFLIDSIFTGIDIGKFGFVRNNDEEWKKTGYSYEILDGKQRLNTIIEFYEDRITYKGYTYSQLGWEDRYTFREHMVSVAEVKEFDRKSILESFLSLNRGGRVMDKSQIEKVEKMLENLSK